MRGKLWVEISNYVVEEVEYVDHHDQRSKILNVSLWLSCAKHEIVFG